MRVLSARRGCYSKLRFKHLFLAGIMMALSIIPLHRAAATHALMAPELPRVYLDTTYMPPSGQTIPVGAGGDFQAALNSAQPGDVITLQAGATFTGNFVLPNKPGAGWITIRSSAPDGSLPLPGARIAPAFAPALPKIVTPNSSPALETAQGAHHFRLIGLEFAVAAGVTQTYSLITLGNNETTLAQLPHDLILDRLYIHGNATVNLRRGVTLNSASTAVIDSYISDCHEVGADSQAIGGWNGAGPFKIVNNHLEGAGENFILGGADPTIANLVPSDIEFRRNHCFKPVAWRQGDPGYGGTPWTVKNLFELKNAQRVLVDGNIFENNWAQAQNGFGILFTVRNQEGTAPWSVVQDVTFRNNIVRHSTNGINIINSDDNNPSEPLRRLQVENNLFDDLGVFSDATRILQIVGDGARGTAASLIFNHNTWLHHAGATQGGIAIAVGDAGKIAQDFVFTNNMFSRTTFGIKGNASGEGKGGLEMFLDGYLFMGNAVIDDPAYPTGPVPINLYPQGNFFPASPGDVGFTAYNGGNGGNYRLATGSAYRNAGTDGKDIGCDFDALEAAISGPGADLRIAKTNGASSVNAGGTTTYTIVVTNNGPGAADDAIFRDPASAGLSVTGVACGSASGGAECPAPASATVAAMQGAGIAIPTMPSGGSVTFAVAATVTAASGSVANTATITAPIGVTDSASGNNTASDTDSVAQALVPEADLRITKTNGASSINAGGTTTYTIVVTNNGPAAANNAVFRDPASAGLSVTGVACGSASGGAECPAPASATVAAMQGAGIAIPTLPSGGSVTFTVTATVTATSGSVANTATITAPMGVADPASGNNTASDTDSVNSGSGSGPAVGPGEPYPSKSEANDNKAGSLLFYNIYGSSAASPSNENTRINLTNTNPVTGVVVHLFFVDGATCSVADSFVCLLPRQTVSFTVAEVDPGTTGYIVAVAVDGPKGFAGGTNTGRPVSFNYLIGDEYIKLSASRYEGNLAAVAFSVVDNGGRPQDPRYDPYSPTAELIFDGAPGNYNRAPHTLAVSNFPSPAGRIAGEQSTQIVINRVGGDLSVGAARIGSVFGLVFDDAEHVASFSLNADACQFRGVLSNSLPRTSPRLETFLPAGHSGWMKLFSLDPEVALVGSVIIGNNSRALLRSGHNMHALTLTKSTSYIIPVFPASC